MQLAYNIRNTHRAVGTKLIRHDYTANFGMTWPGSQAMSRCDCVARPASRWALLRCKACKLEVLGDANDYVGKGLSGGIIVVRPAASSPLVPKDNVIVGNTVLYGATAGKLFAAGQAGERFCVRNSGARAVVEGCGANGCEYMTGGFAVILGPVGHNFAAGMTGGMAFVYDPADRFVDMVNEDTVHWQRIETEHWDSVLRELVAEHARETRSAFAEALVRDWDREQARFWQVVPKEMLDRLEHPVGRIGDEQVSAAGQ